MNHDKYPHKHAPPASVLRARWAEKTPRGNEIESFLLRELCESSEHEYFLAVSDILLDAVARQSDHERNFSLNVLVSRILDAAEFARGICNDTLLQHFQTAIEGFMPMYFEAAGFEDLKPANPNNLSAYLVMRAIQANDLPLARLIFYREREIICTNTECDNCENEIRCPKCNEYLIPYVQHQRYHNCRNLPAHPASPPNADA